MPKFNSQPFLYAKGYLNLKSMRENPISLSKELAGFKKKILKTFEATYVNQ